MATELWGAKYSWIRTQKVLVKSKFTFSAYSKAAKHYSCALSIGLVLCDQVSTGSFGEEDPD